MVPLTAIRADALDLPALIAAVTAAQSEAGTGAVATFLGLVRGQNAGRRVQFLDYEAFDSLAEKALARIVTEARERWPDARLGIHHRTGRLQVGDASVAIAVGSPHRAEAFAVCRYAIERIKQIVPVWKHEHFEGGEVWIEGATANPDDPEALARAASLACA